MQHCVCYLKKCARVYNKVDISLILPDIILRLGIGYFDLLPPVVLLRRHSVLTRYRRSRQRPSSIEDRWTIVGWPLPGLGHLLSSQQSVSSSVLLLLHSHLWGVQMGNDQLSTFLFVCLCELFEVEMQLSDSMQKLSGACVCKIFASSVEIPGITWIVFPRLIIVVRWI